MDRFAFPSVVAGGVGCVFVRSVVRWQQRRRFGFSVVSGGRLGVINPTSSSSPGHGSFGIDVAGTSRQRSVTPGCLRRYYFLFRRRRGTPVTATSARHRHVRDGEDGGLSEDWIVFSFSLRGFLVMLVFG